jgi:hypothetical protein
MVMKQSTIHEILQVTAYVIYAFCFFTLLNTMPWWGMVLAISTLVGLQLYGNKRMKDLDEDLFGLRQGWFESRKDYLDRIWAVSGQVRPEDKTALPWESKACKLTNREEQK